MSQVQFFGTQQGPPPAAPPIPQDGRRSVAILTPAGDMCHTAYCNSLAAMIVHTMATPDLPLSALCVNHYGSSILPQGRHRLALRKAIALDAQLMPAWRARGYVSRARADYVDARLAFSTYLAGTDDKDPHRERLAAALAEVEEKAAVQEALQSGLAMVEHAANASAAELAEAEQRLMFVAGKEPLLAQAWWALGVLKRRDPAPAAQKAAQAGQKAAQKAAQAGQKAAQKAGQKAAQAGQKAAQKAGTSSTSNGTSGFSY